MKIKSRGIVVAADANIEWILPWWWHCYSLYNQYPVFFVDFGMSPAMRRWCRRKGHLHLLKQSIAIKTKKEILSHYTNQWEDTYRGNVWKARQGWFKKPWACLQTPFDLNIWLDLDCEVCGSLDSLFREWEEGIQLALINDKRKDLPVNYSSGVFLFYKAAPFLKLWAERCYQDNDKYLGDQNILTELILEERIPIKELDLKYNWIMYQGINLGALIVHWGGGWGKKYIRKFGGLHQFIQKKQKGCLSKNTRATF